MPAEPSVFQPEVYQRNDSAFHQHRQKVADIEEEIGTPQIENLVYARVMQDWLRCNHMFIEKLEFPAVMNQ